MAVAALLISGLSCYLGYRGIVLANNSVEIAAKTYREEAEARALSQAPVLQMNFSQDEQTISIGNEGWGPAQVFLLQLSYNKRYLRIDQRDTQSDQLSKLRDFLVESLYEFDPGYKLSKAEAVYIANSISVYKVNSDKIITRFYFEENHLKLKLLDFYYKINSQVCYTDLRQIHKGVYHGGNGRSIFGECPEIIKN